MAPPRQAAGVPPQARGNPWGQPTPQQKRTQATARSAESRNRRAPTQAQAGDEEEDIDENIKSDLGPWTETPSSTRVRAFRYDYANRAIQVTWRNQKNPGYLYEERDYEEFRSFARAASKGKYINRVLTGNYRPLSPDEVALPSNAKRRGTASRVRQ